MTTIVNRLLIILGILFFYPSFSQSLSEKIASAEKIYVAPLQFYAYYGLKVGAGLGTKPYSLDGEFAIGNVVSVTDPNYSYEIVGEVPAEHLKAINEHLLSKLQEKWGADKVKAWPEDMMNKLGNYNQKGIDCDLYVMMRRAAWQEPLRLIKLSSSDPDVKSVIKEGMENIKLIIFEKVKAGKKGKKVVKVMKNPFRDLTVEFSDADNYSEAGAEFSKKANEQLQTVVDEMLADFYAEVEKN